jgi:DNA-binding IclR family transcriptional regulator
VTPSPYQRLRDLPAHVRAPALEILDQLTQPLSPRALDRAIQDEGLSRSEARRITKILKRLQVVALVGR